MQGKSEKILPMLLVGCCLFAGCGNTIDAAAAATARLQDACYWITQSEIDRRVLIIRTLAGRGFSRPVATEGTLTFCTERWYFVPDSDCRRCVFGLIETAY